MLKNLLLKKLIPLIIYSAVYLYFVIFNWKVFTISLNVNLGFGIVKMTPFIYLFLLGFILIGVLSWISYITSLRKIIYELEHGEEKGNIKDRLLRPRLKDYLGDEKNLSLLEEKLGIPEIRKKNEVMRKQLDALMKKDQSRMDQ